MPRLLATLLAALLASVACTDRQEIVIFHSPSLSRVLLDIGEEFAKQNPQFRLRVEVSASLVATRKLTELNLLADVLVLADADVIDKMLLPDYADWNVRFAINEIVLAHAAHSRYTEEITTDNWPAILTRSHVRLGLANPDTSPLGYQTLFVLGLAESAYRYPNLAQTLRTGVAPEHIAADEAELWALLSSRAIDYAFLYRSTAEDQRLKLTALPADINLSQPEHEADYAKAAASVVLKHDQTPVTIRGATIWYGVTVPRAAPHPEAAQKYVAFLLGESGQRALRHAGFRPCVPALSAQWRALPADVQRLAVASQPQ